MKRRWVGVSLLFGAGIINFVDRNALPLAAPLIAKEFSLTPGEMGIVFSIFFLGYTLCCFLGGLASDRFGPKRVFTAAMLTWSLFCGLTALTFNFASLLVVRILFGAGEGPFSSATNKFISNWFPKKQVGTAIAAAGAGTTVGGVIAGPVLGYLFFSFGWRPAFLIIAVAGLVWLFFWVKLSSDSPLTDKRVSDSERLEMLADEPESSADEKLLPLRQYLKSPVILATAFAFFGMNYVLYFFLSWYPSYLTTVHGLNVKDMGMISMIPWLAATIGYLSGGMLSDRIYRWTGNLLFSRKIMLVVFLSFSGIAIICAGMVKSLIAGVALTSVAMFLLYLTTTSYWAIVQAVVPKPRVGGVSGFVHALANIAGITGPAITGFMVQSTNSFASAFALAGTIAALGAIAIFVFVKPIRVQEAEPAVLVVGETTTAHQ
jgi:ACS family hexuronate transporter-like MFS transporter